MVKCKTIFDRYVGEVWRLLNNLENAKEYLCSNLKEIIPREWSIYLFKDKLGKAMYLGQSCDKKGGLYKRIIKEHLNPNYHNDIGGSDFIRRVSEDKGVTQGQAIIFVENNFTIKFSVLSKPFKEVALRRKDKRSKSSILDLAESIATEYHKPKYDSRDKDNRK